MPKMPVFSGRVVVKALERIYGFYEDVSVGRKCAVSEGAHEGGVMTGVYYE